MQEVIRFGWPEGVTPQATEMRHLWTWLAIASLVVGVIVWGLTAWTVIFHRKRGEGELPRQFQYSLPVEIVSVVLPTIIVAAIFGYTVLVQNDVDKSIAKPDVKVDVTAFQWNWEFDYPENPTGKKISTLGTSETIPILVLPTDKSIEFTITSTDVIHSFFVPEFLFKRDVFPDPEKNDTDNTFVIDKIERQGAFVGRCAELCGSYHSVMNFEVRALSPDLYAKYLQKRTETNPVSGVPNTAGEALASLGCGELCSPTAVTTYPFKTERTHRSASQRSPS
ncbi:cytochrome c oxidase subunit II [Pseudonocardia eucalypti]|uniref:cytochrome-c oxidase n=1 Tax=Pseudonocardia eucalypti TaxID=648755 RepID=A0ABP9R4R8_9PSEU|nr:cytochrome c oxidase subunit 2 [Pseudonocardia eucalypti]